jgi:hypothetical protein
VLALLPAAIMIRWVVYQVEQALHLRKVWGLLVVPLAEVSHHPVQLQAPPALRIYPVTVEDHLLQPLLILMARRWVTGPLPLRRWAFLKARMKATA